MPYIPYKPTIPFTGPLSVEMTFYMPIPKAFSKKKRSQAIAGDIRHTKKPDIDNLCKSVLDTLNNIFFEDDKQIVRLSASKCYSDTPSIMIHISET